MHIQTFWWFAFSSALIVNTQSSNGQCDRMSFDQLSVDKSCLCRNIFVQQLLLQLSETKHHLTSVLEHTKEEILCITEAIIKDALRFYAQTTTTTITKPKTDQSETTKQLKATTTTTAKQTTTTIPTTTTKPTTTTTTTKPTTRTTPTTTTKPTRSTKPTTTTTTTKPTTMTPELTTEAVQIPTNCKEALESGNNTSAVYTIKPDISLEPFEVNCEVALRGGGWTVVLNRADGNLDFYQEWKRYQIGFSNKERSEEFWLGLDHLYELTASTPNEILFEMVDDNMVKKHAHYDEIVIGNESEYYLLKKIGKYSGDAGDSFSFHQGAAFSTFNKDHTDRYCSRILRGAWWYQNDEECAKCNPTGQTLEPNETFPVNIGQTGIYWVTMTGLTRSLAEIRIMIRPKS